LVIRTACVTEFQKEVDLLQAYIENGGETFKTFPEILENFCLEIFYIT